LTRFGAGGDVTGSISGSSGTSTVPGAGIGQIKPSRMAQVAIPTGLCEHARILEFDDVPWTLMMVATSPSRPDQRYCKILRQNPTVQPVSIATTASAGSEAPCPKLL
jgi:hypothetical protein